MPAGAQQPDELGIWFPRDEAADLLSRAGEQATLQKTIEAQDKMIAGLEHIVEIQGRLVELAEREAEAYERLAAIMSKERDAYKAQVERKDRSMRWLQCRANAGVGALIGAAAGSAFPGVGTVAGGAVGAIGGCISGLTGAP